MISYLKLVLLIQMFFAVAVTIFAHALPADAKTFINEYSSIASTSNLESTISKVKTSLESQTNIPIIEMGALVYYSGNMVVDLLLNFLLAIPEMITLLINGVCTLINIDAYYIVQMQLFIGGVLTVGYMLGMIQFVTSIRSGLA